MAKVKKGFHKTKSGRVAKKGLYFFTQIKEERAGKKPSRKGKSGYCIC